MAHRNVRWIFLFLTPAVVLFLVVFGASTVVLVSSSFFDWHLAEKLSFNGFHNYYAFFQDATFKKALSNTLIWIVVFSPLHVLIGLIVALILAQKQFYWRFLRTAYMIPNIISGAALGMLYLAVLNPKFGLVNGLIRLLGNKDFELNWFYSYSTAFLTVTMTWLPFAAILTILILAEIAAIPDSVIESAKLDGATEFQKNRYIIIPMLRNIIGTCLILAVANLLKSFDIIFLTTNGGPGDTTMNLPLYIYKVAMLENNYGYANALGTFLVILGIAALAAISKIFRMGESDL